MDTKETVMFAAWLVIANVWAAAGFAGGGWAGFAIGAVWLVMAALLAYPSIRKW